jgi:type I restriction enzyme S subunit
VREGWRLTTIGEVCEIVNGGTPKTNIADYWGGHHFWITPAEMGKRTSPYVVDTVRKLTDLGLGNCSARLLPPLSVILSSRAPIGHLVINTDSMATNQGCKGLVPNKSLDHKFLFYYLTSIVDLLNDLGTGTTFKELSGGKLKEVCLPLPTLSEQKRIVAILDEAFEGLATAVANAEKNLANARELFDSYLNSVFVQKGKGWVAERLEDTVEMTCSLSYGIVQPGEDVSDGLPIVRPTDLQSKFIGLSRLKRIDPAIAEGYKRTKLYGGELLLCVRGGTGSVSIAAKELAGSNVTRGIVPIRFDGSVVLQEFGYFAFISKGVQDQIRAATYGAALMQINIRDLKKVSLDLPPLVVQKDLLGKLRAERRL